MIDRLRYGAFAEEPGGPPPESDVVEIPLLLPGWQMDVLERVAHEKGLTAAEMVRQLLRSFVAEAQKKMGVSRGPTPYVESAL
jgi:hypothetical protein